ncbi:MAG: family 43 glycosylhydrolase, partial [Actinomycetota bacterium]
MGAVVRSGRLGRAVLVVFAGVVLGGGVTLWWHSGTGDGALPAASRLPVRAVPAVWNAVEVPEVEAAVPVLLGPEARPVTGPRTVAPSTPDEIVVLVAGDGRPITGADPAIVRDGGVWRVFTTQEFFVNVPSWESVDGQTWTSTGDAMPVLPPWASWGLTWAPDVVQVGDGWVLFFSALVDGTDRHCIGHAVAADAVGPFEPFVEPLVCELDEGGSIDPSVFENGDERVLLWKVDANAIGGDSVLRAQR